MGAVILPEGVDGTQLHRWLWEQHRVEIPVQKIGPRFYLRASCQSYNLPSHFERLNELLGAYVKSGVAN
jgi:hypothetical protein